MLNLIKLRDNCTFFLIALINSIVCFSLFGISEVLVGVLTTFFSYIAYCAKDDRTNILYIALILTLIIAAAGIGFLLKLSLYFYLFLFAISYFYYISYNKDIIIDRVIPFIVIFACMGTTLPAVTTAFPLAFLIGISISLSLLALLKHKGYDSEAFKRGLFSKQLYQSKKRLGLRALVYSLFLFLSLVIPDYLNLYRIYWSPLTFIVLLHPKEVGIVKITLSRFIGSTLGALFIFSLLYLKPLNNIYFDITLVAIVSFFMPTFLQLNYVLKTFAITVFVLLLIEETEFLGDPTYLLPYSRIYETLIGGSIALCASFILKKMRNISSSS